MMNIKYMKGFRNTQKKESKRDQVRRFTCFLNKFNELKSQNHTLESLKELFEKEKPGGMKKEAFIEMANLLMGQQMEEQFKKETEEYNKQLKENKNESKSEESGSI